MNTPSENGLFLQPAIPRKQRAVLKINNKSFKIYDGLNVVGRKKDAVVNIKNLTVSQNHAIITVVDQNHHFVSDFDSSNGTRINNIKLSPYILKKLTDNSQIWFGEVSGVYSFDTTENEEASQCETSQMFTQNFYGTNTQILEDTIESNSLISKTSTEPIEQEIIDIPTQVLNNFVDDLENENQNHNCIHNMPTQILTLKPENVSAQNNNIHEAETQILSETQRFNFFSEMDSNVSQKTNRELIEFHEAQTQIMEEAPSETPVELSEQTTQILTVENDENVQTTLIDQITEADIVEDTINNDYENSNESEDLLQMLSLKSVSSTEPSQVHVVYRRSRNPLDSDEDDQEQEDSLKVMKESQIIQKHMIKGRQKPVIQDEEESNNEPCDEKNVVNNLSDTLVSSDAETDIDDDLKINEDDHEQWISSNNVKNYQMVQKHMIKGCQKPVIQDEEESNNEPCDAKNVVNNLSDTLVSSDAETDIDDDLKINDDDNHKHTIKGCQKPVIQDEEKSNNEPCYGKNVVNNLSDTLVSSDAETDIDDDLKINEDGHEHTIKGCQKPVIQDEEKSNNEPCDGKNVVNNLSDTLVSSDAETDIDEDLKINEDDHEHTIKGCQKPVIQDEEESNNEPGNEKNVANNLSDTLVSSDAETDIDDDLKINEDGHKHTIKGCQKPVIQDEEKSNNEPCYGKNVVNNLSDTLVSSDAETDIDDDLKINEDGHKHTIKGCQKPVIQDEEKSNNEPCDGKNVVNNLSDTLVSSDAETDIDDDLKINEDGHKHTIKGCQKPVIQDEEKSNNEPCDGKNVVNNLSDTLVSSDAETDIDDDLKINEDGHKHTIKGCQKPVIQDEEKSNNEPCDGKNVVNNLSDTLVSSDAETDIDDDLKINEDDHEHMIKGCQKPVIQDEEESNNKPCDGKNVVNNLSDTLVSSDAETDIEDDLKIVEDEQWTSLNDVKESQMVQKHMIKACQKPVIQDEDESNNEPCIGIKIINNLQCDILVNSDAETDVEDDSGTDKRYNNNQDVITATQDINSSIPATQELPQCSSQINSDKNLEDSFKLGLTEVMEDGVYCVATQKLLDDAPEPVDNCSKNEENIYFQETQKLLADDMDFPRPCNATKKDKKVNSIYLASTNKLVEDNVYDAPTQKLPLTSSETQNIYQVNENSVFCVATQKLLDDVPEPAANCRKNEESIYFQATQKLLADDMDFPRPCNATKKDKKVNSIYLASTNKLVEDNVYDAPTQKLPLTSSETQNTYQGNENSVFCVATQKLLDDAPEPVDSCSKNEENIYFQATQKLLADDTDFLRPYNATKKDKKVNSIYLASTNKLVEDNVYDAPTQKLPLTSSETQNTYQRNENGVYCAATQKLLDDVPEPVDNCSKNEESIYFKATQKLLADDTDFPNPSKVTKKDKNINSIYLVSTNKLVEDNVYDVPTQNTVQGNECSVYYAATQKLLYDVPEPVANCNKNQESIYVQATEKLLTDHTDFSKQSKAIKKDEMYLTPTQKLVKGDLYDAPTQQLALSSSETQNADSLYCAATQKLPDVYEEATQINFTTDNVESQLEVNFCSQKLLLPEVVETRTPNPIITVLDQEDSTLKLTIDESESPNESHFAPMIDEQMEFHEEYSNNNNNNKTTLEQSIIKMAVVVKGKKKFNFKKNNLASGSNKLEVGEKNKLAGRKNVNVSTEITINVTSNSKGKSLKRKSPSDKMLTSNSEIEDIPSKKPKHRSIKEVNRPDEIKPERRSKRTTLKSKLPIGNEKQEEKISANRKGRRKNLEENTEATEESDVFIEEVPKEIGAYSRKKKVNDNNNVEIVLQSRAAEQHREKIEVVASKDDVVPENILIKRINKNRKQLEVGGNQNGAPNNGNKSQESHYQELVGEGKTVHTEISVENKNDESNGTNKIVGKSKKKVGSTSEGTSRQKTKTAPDKIMENKEKPPLGGIKSRKSRSTSAKIELDLDDFKKPGKIGERRKRGVSIASSTSSNESEASNATPTKSRKTIAGLSDSVLTSSERAKRCLKPKVVFTMMDSPELESVIRQLGGSVVNSVDACTVLVTKQVKRSEKLLVAVGQGKPICSPDWLLACKKAHTFLDPWEFLLKDQDAEKKWDFSLAESLNRSSNQKLLQSYSFLIVVNNAADVLKSAIEACGGKRLMKAPKTSANFVVVSTKENKSKYSKYKKQNSELLVIEAEAVFDGVLRQEIRFHNHKLS